MLSPFADLLCVAAALYLWESALWIPPRCVALRKAVFGKGWKVLDPRALFTGRELGLVPMLPLPFGGGLAPCQPPPVIALPDGGFLVVMPDETLVPVDHLSWDEIIVEDRYLSVSGIKTRLISKRYIEFLHLSKARGSTPAEAIRQSWRLAFSPGRSAREWRRWRIVSSGLRWYCPLLALVFLAGLPLAYIYLGILPMLYLLLWCWVVMIYIATRFWWLGRRVYPEARSSLRTDAGLSLLVPFHAMRAVELASIHSMGMTHPAGLLIAQGDLDNPWLGTFIRRLLHPRPGTTGERSFSSALLPLLESSLRQVGRTPADYDHPAARTDEASTRYCPRCHGIYLPAVASCGDCKGIPLIDFASNPADS